MATLYIVATPIGNLEDITLRAVRVLGEVGVVACEDTRHTGQLLHHLGIKKPLVACYAYEEAKGSARVLGLLAGGTDVAYCSDAGTPCLSDPGTLLTKLAREAGHLVVPIPGPSAFAALVSAAGLFFKSVCFDGFLSPKPGRRRSRLTELMEREEAAVLYESPHRIVKLLADIADIDGQRQICVGREMTKLHEEFVAGSAESVYADFAGRQSIKGEFAVLVAAAKKA
ncbi:MAG: 16S rRNA (cytidine(1402)-2'-O)-methyltransferase [Spirochaetes bacterium GWD1_61_31]|nr:MAG: 16S rRNA (cytidine(1402)-2'-O)-methyltransferase [Spirochaetes bacterium GWB1_60_80]OHD35520.1 MAG: 16S rRNA (cytidine(1402)-2'-O)-methyltransferase [Spirochaetes bacterium GWC1_61_12]OHD38997.1 MAG: 16S rRNA (cytidine(1402)-2'-O)-methyltransferase [Spirochaetes bacterium GWD1_61_31]OHD43496.1 MAG: 16S rRNA (cytidine(1402)-2'-O)-methyltransferase [Spirochaetes bacterium GWE1_60_18]OHD60759.1 MAG: 16S rRNA (cytidine(1402)-2'-O)-methyltransferase [Spirochaetes bacterium GWF1_60_12]HAW864